MRARAARALRAGLAALALLAAVLGLGPAEVRAAQAMVNAEVPAAKWKAIRLKNLPAGARVGIQAEALSGSGPLGLIFVHGDELKRFPAAVTPEFHGSIERKLSFAVTISRKGDYYVILDNRQGSEARKARLVIRAERGRSSRNPAPPRPSPGSRETDI